MLIIFPYYIDPGTGSALFSILIAAAATLYFVSRSLVIRAKTLFTREHAARRVREEYVIYCEGPQYINVFKPVLDEFEARKLPVLYISSAKDDPAFTAAYKYIKPEFIAGGNKAFARLNFLSADVVLMTTPGLDVYQLKRARGVRHYAHILHAASDATMYRMFGIDYYDSILLTGAYQADDIRALEKIRGIPEKQLVTVGCTYLDAALERLGALKKEAEKPFTVLVSPSWGASALLSKYGERLLTPLAAACHRIIVRPHPQSRISEAAMLDALAAKYKDAANIEWDYERDNLISLSKADIMLSDFSGIIFDFLFLFDRPVMYACSDIDLRPYDADDLGEDAREKLWQFRVLKEAGIELREDMFANIGAHIKEAVESTALREGRAGARDAAWQHRGEAGRRVVDFMIQSAAVFEEKSEAAEKKPAAACV